MVVASIVVIEDSPKYLDCFYSTDIVVDIDLDRCCVLQVGGLMCNGDAV